MSARSRSLPWWEDCDTAGHRFVLEFHDGTRLGKFVCSCEWCRRRELRHKRSTGPVTVYPLPKDPMFLPIETFSSIGLDRS